MARWYTIVKRFAIKRVMETNIRRNSTVGPGFDALGGNKLFSPRESGAISLDLDSWLLQSSRDRRRRDRQVEGTDRHDLRGA